MAGAFGGVLHSKTMTPSTETEQHCAVSRLAEQSPSRVSRTTERGEDAASEMRATSVVVWKCILVYAEHLSSLWSGDSKSKVVLVCA